MDCEVLAEMLVDQTELLFRHGPHKLIGKNARGECFVLRCLARSKAPLLPSDLSEQSHASTARIAVVLNTLEKKGLISRAIDPTDRRRILVSLTNVGQEYVAVVRTQLREDMKGITGVPQAHSSDFTGGIRGEKSLRWLRRQFSYN